ncbi:hypothetical protein DJ533_00175 (plasmid) [Acinetobacter defluvii]|uniref:Phage tail protein n=1 Tax=Acinetobacter defluvii TaxID=1871111 RepID=A0A2S2F8I2_9GAMM|nr:hypothetical protein [Acinetobacter defluvii]AWL27135.1 hypothetical protein DJ533_00175 [Acinetobacter defluvii]
MATEANEIVFTVTHVGRNAALNAELVGLVLKLDKMGFGDGHGVSNDTVASLASKKQETEMSAGGVQPATNTLMLGINYTPTQDLNASEIGIYTEDGVLFAIARKEVGHFFILSKGIPFIASFGLRLGGIDAERVQLSVMQDAPIAQQMIFDHESHPDPHPQYTKAVSDLKKYVDDFFNQFSGDIDGQYNKLKDDIDKIIKDLSDSVNTDLELLKKAIEDIIKRLNAITYPRTIACGVVNGIASEGTFFEIDLNDKVDDLRDNKYIIHITPESSHEAWRIVRESQKFKLHVWNRSGTNRIGYSGSVGWSVIQSSGESVGLDGDFLEGAYSITIPKWATARIILVGGGGGGGMAVHQGDDSTAIIHGKSGGDSYIEFANQVVASAGGGKGGTGGWWDNGSAWGHGEGGAGGIFTNTNSVSMKSSKNGNKGLQEQYDHVGGASVSPVLSYGAGGKGGDGVGNNNEGWAAGGGSGAYIEFTVTTSLDPIYLKLVVGGGGKAGTYEGSNQYGSENRGVAGTTGFARIAIQKNLNPGYTPPI